MCLGRGVEKYRWLVEDKLIHLARIDTSPLSFLVLEESEHSIKGSLYFLEMKVPKKHREERFCEVKESSIKLPAPLDIAFSNYADEYKVCEFTMLKS